MESHIAVFKGKEIRKTIHRNEWWFSVSDVVEVLTDSADPKQYIKKMRQRDTELNSYWGTICTPLELMAPDGKAREINCANTEGIFRIIQSIPSPKAEPFKRWLAKIGCERVQEIREELPGVQGFSPSNPWRMKIFLQTYESKEKLAPLAREIGWPHNIFSKNCLLFHVK